MEVVANGRPVTVPEGATVADLLERMGLTGRVVVVERNGNPLDRESIGHVTLQSGDWLEVVRAVAGG